MLSRRAHTKLKIRSRPQETVSAILKQSSPTEGNCARAARGDRRAAMRACVRDILEGRAPMPAFTPKPAPLSDDHILARELGNCVHCDGTDLYDHQRRCACVSRAAFRRCWVVYRFLQMPERFMLIDHCTVASDYCADLYLMAKRTLSAPEWRLFELHFLQGLTWQPCCARLNMGRENFFFAVYRIQRKLGRAFIDTRPHPLYPLSGYFGCEPAIFGATHG